MRTIVDLGWLAPVRPSPAKGRLVFADQTTGMSRLPTQLRRAHAGPSGNNVLVCTSRNGAEAPNSRQSTRITSQFRGRVPQAWTTLI